MAIVLAFTLLGVGAFAVDFGQVYAKRSSLQSAADQAVLAAAAELDGTNTCTAAARNAATTYLLANWVDQAGDPLTAAGINLSSGPDDNGFLRCQGWRAQLWAPEATVNPGMADSLPGPNLADIEIPAYAEAGVFSPKAAVMPSFAVSGCDYGPQTLLDPPSGPAVVYVPNLPFPSPTNPAKLLQGTDASGGPAGLDPDVITLNQLSSLRVYGTTGGPTTKLNNVKRIAFSTEDGQRFIVPASGFTINSNTLITVAEIPSLVRTTEKVWWVRVSNDLTGETWSKTDEALPLRVGQPVLECAGVSNSGNFGTIDLPHLTPPANAEKAIEWNIATQVDYGLTTLPSGPYCSPGTGGAIAPTVDGTNCVQAKTGFAGNPATNGLITGVAAGTPGRLVTDTTDGCDPVNGSSEYHTDMVKGSKYWINDDTLTCFFDNNSSTIASIASAGYTGDRIVTADVFESPRFFWVPVFGIQPDNGTSHNYAILDFRPAFITGEQPASTRSASVMDSVTHNGLATTNAGIQSLKVVFFNHNALPESIAGGDVMDYLGVGTKVIRLTD